MKLLNSFCLSILLFACNNGRYKIDKEEIHCEIFEIDHNNLIEKKCYYNDGNPKEFSYWRNDTIQVNEHYVYSAFGKIKEYHFYDLAGFIRFSRFYDKNGNLTEERGDILSHDVLSSYETKLGDSVVVKIFVATPPGSGFKVYGINSDGRYNLNNTSNTKFISRHVIRPSKPGDYLFVYEIDFVDSLKNTTLTRKSEVSFKIVD